MSQALGPGHAERGKFLPVDVYFLAFYPSGCASLKKKKKWLNVIIWFNFLAPAWKSLGSPLREFLVDSWGLQTGTKPHVPSTLKPWGSSCKHQGGFELRLKEHRWHFKNIQALLLLPEKLLQAFPCVNITRQGPHPAELLPNWATSEGHTKAGVLDEAH